MKKIHGRDGFSLVEALATVAIVGIITFLALPNVVSAREDAERSMAVARAESLNMAIASFVQARGFSEAAKSWKEASVEEAQYALLSSYLAYAPASLKKFVPAGYKVTFPAAGITRPLLKVDLAIDGATPTPIAY